MDALSTLEAAPLAEAREGHALEDKDQVGPTPDSEENKFQRAISSWRAIDLSGLIPRLDTTASEIVAHQRDALVERKDLAQKTKDFRRLDDAAKLVEYKGLLKAYQGFIDLLTNHGKTTSSAFLQIYSSLSDAPDPYPLLEASVESLVISEDTVPKLTSENKELQRRVTRLSAQLEESERRIEDESIARKQVQEGVEVRSKEVEAAWAKVLEENQNNWTLKEKNFEQKIENQERLLKEIKAGYEVAQRLKSGEESTSVSAHGTASAAELEMMGAELEKTTARLADIEARNEQLRLELAHVVSQAGSGVSSRRVEEDPTFVRLQSENSSMLRRIESIQFDKGLEMREWESKYRQADRQRLQLETSNLDLNEKLRRWSDYDDLRRELDVLRSIELSIGDDDEQQASEPPVQMNGSTHTDKSQSLEQLLLARNKKLSSELTILRVSHQELLQQLEALREEFSRTNSELENSQQLSSTLENDILRMQEEAANAMPSSAMSVAGTYISRHPHSSRRGRSSPTSSIISGYETQSRGPSSTLESLRSGEPVGGGSGILPMIQAQRDRFKQKNSQLEEDLSKTYATVTSLRQEIASLQKDNLNLYEKTRYVSAYSRGPTTTSSSAFSHEPSHTTIQMGSDPPTLPTDRYRSQYEDKISPFAAFRGRESARAYKRMTLPERIVFSVTRMVLATRTSRNLFAGYCFALHLLIVFVLYWAGSTEVEKHANHLGDSVVATGDAMLRSSINNRKG